MKVGLIGTPQLIQDAIAWLQQNAHGVRGDEKHPEFPGFMSDRGFLCELEFDDAWQAEVTQSEVRSLLEVRSSRERFEQCVALYDAKLRLLAERDTSPDYVLVPLSTELVTQCGKVDFKDKILGSVHRDLRRALKAVFMKYRIPTQLVRQPTLQNRDATHPSKIAWNFFTGLYFKAGGLPWAPYGLRAGTCYVGVGFYRPLGSESSRMQTSLVQAFDEHGEGLVLRGFDFEWDSRKEGSPSPHLTEDQCGQLLELVLARYQDEMKQLPARVVVHKTSRYWPSERAGFSLLGEEVAAYDLLAIEKRTDVRLMTTTKYPPLRGTRFTLGDLDFLYTSGFLASLGEFHGVHVPSPLLIADHVGQDTPREVLLNEVLTLSKMNWNAASFSGSLPVTLMFSRMVGEIMREIPGEIEPLPQFKYYM